MAVATMCPSSWRKWQPETHDSGSISPAMVSPFFCRTVPTSRRQWSSLEVGSALQQVPASRHVENWPGGFPGCGPISRQGAPVKLKRRRPLFILTEVVSVARLGVGWTPAHDLRF